MTGHQANRRKQTRLPNFDYRSNGAYFVTVCTHQRKASLGSICKGDPCGRPPTRPYVHLTPLGTLADQTVAHIEALYPVQIPVHVVMPDHLHMIIIMDWATARVAPTSNHNIPSLGQVVGAFKSKVSYDWLQLCKQQEQQMGKLWQRGYYDHIIRSKQDLFDCAEYIMQNPLAWLERHKLSPV